MTESRTQHDSDPEEARPSGDPSRKGRRGALRPGGALFVEVPNHGSLARRLLGDAWLGWRTGEHVYVFSKRTLVALVRAAGFEPVSVCSFVPGWDGLLPDAYAHFLGLQRAMCAAIDAKRRLARPTRRNAVVGEDHEADPPGSPEMPIRDLSRVRRVIYGRGFAAIGRVEERVGLGTYIRLLARPRPSR